MVLMEAEELTAALCAARAVAAAVAAELGAAQESAVVSDRLRTQAATAE